MITLWPMSYLRSYKGGANKAFSSRMPDIFSGDLHFWVNVNQLNLVVISRFFRRFRLSFLLLLRLFQPPDPHPDKAHLLLHLDPAQTIEGRLPNLFQRI